MVLHATWLLFLMTCIIEYSYSNFFNNNQYTSIAVLHVLWKIVGAMFEAGLSELLLTAPLEVCMAVNEI